MSVQDSLVVARLREAEDALLAYHSAYGACPGIEVEWGLTSGCSAASTGAKDCPTCTAVEVARHG